MPELGSIEERLKALEINYARLRAPTDLAGVLTSPRSPMAAFDSGTYTPTLTNGANVAASTAYESQWIRIDDIVNVSGKVDVDPTAALTATVLGVSLPIPSVIGAEEDVSGVCGQHSVTALSAGSVNGSTANNIADLRMHPSGAVNAAWSFIFQYHILA